MAKLSMDSGFGEVKAWWTAVQAPEPTATSPAAWASEDGSNSGGATIQTNDQADWLLRPGGGALSARVARSSARAEWRPPAAKKMQPPGAAPTCATSPARSASDRFF